jgi:AmiR/NasT family two-component response regulator
LRTNRQIGTAVGILMSSHLITYDEAFRVLRTASHHSNRKLRDVADHVVETGALPANVHRIKRSGTD